MDNPETSSVSNCHDVCWRLEPTSRCEGGHRLGLLSNGEVYVPAMLESISRASRYVDLELYRVDPGHLWDDFLSRLAAAAARGVEVRLLADSFGSRRMSAEAWRRVRRAGVNVHLTPSPLTMLIRERSTRRDHRKILIVDGRTAFTGGMSIDDTFFRPAFEPTWRETMVRIEGPLVRGMLRAFDDAWGIVQARTGSSTTPSTFCGPALARLVLSSRARPRGEALFVSAIEGARRTVFITNPFVVPSRRISDAIVAASAKGVDVRLLVPGEYHRFPWVRDVMRSFYGKYLGAGVRILEYDAAMIHAKTIVVDEEWASVGSFNLDARSFVHNDEVAIASCDAVFARQVAAAFHVDCESAHTVSPGRMRARSFASRCRQATSVLLRGFL